MSFHSNILPNLKAGATAGLGALKDRYTDDDGTISWTNVGKDAGMASTAYAALNPNDSETIGNFMGTNQQGPVGYMGGIPNYTATRELLPNAFAQTNTDPTTQDVTARRPGSAGRQYFTDTTFAPDTTEPIMGKTAVEIAADNKQNLANQAIYESLMGDAFDARVASGATTAGGATASDGVLTANELASIATGKYFDNGDGTYSDAIGNIFNEVNGQLTVDQALTGEELIARDGPAVAAMNAFLSKYTSGQPLTAADAAALAASGYSINQIATGLSRTPKQVKDFLDFHAPADDVVTKVIEKEEDYDVNASLEQMLIAGNSDYTANEDGTFTGPGNYIYDYQNGLLETVGTPSLEQRLIAGNSDYTANTDGTFTGPSGYVFDYIDGELTTLRTPSGADVPAAITANAAELDTFGTIANIRSQEEIVGIQEGITAGKWDAGDVAEQFNLPEIDVIEELIRDGFYGADDTAIADAAAGAAMEEEELVVQLLRAGKTNFAEVAEYYQDQFPGITAAQVKANFDKTEFAQGGNVNGYYLGGPTDGMADQIPATIDNSQPAALSDGEFVIPADIVSHLGNGNSEAGADNLYDMMERVRTDRTGNPNQGRQIDPNEYLA